ncbi:putative transcriptional regulator SLK2 [Heracleum sosnowskyi]|uniref:Transcriptional regulator SLK2 n=1 Tax=Heracleum sosnowskyi TaxID=360622 RepID=A0AAD8MR56_9APIA|nr:putative transcriptional regulator SLK2 [Heracleum sosnowskyi]
MAPYRVAGGESHSSSSSGIFSQESNSMGNTRVGTSFGNSLHSLPGSMHPNLGQFSRDASNTMLNIVRSSGLSAEESSLVTDANSGLSGGPNLQRSASINTESYMRLPASPMSFSSNNISISGTPIIDRLSVHQSSFEDSKSQLMRENQLKQGASRLTSLATAHTGQVSLQNAHRFVQDPFNVSHVQKKPRLDSKQEDILQQQFIQQLLQRQDSVQFQASNPQLQALVQQQKLRQQQQQLLQSMPPVKQTWLLDQQQQEQQQMQLRQQLQQQGMQSASYVKRPSDGGVCSRRVMQYLYHQRHRPPDNNIAYWRKFVAEYYSPRAKKRWCLSLYNNDGQKSSGILPQSAMDGWQCDMCGSKSGRGFEASFEVLPRLNEIKFGSGVIDELLFLDLPRECRFPSGIMMLEYGKAVQESVYEQLRVIREGQLRIIFTADLKILCWEFCARRHEDLISRRLVAPQVNQLLQVAQKCQSTITESGTGGASQQNLQKNCSMFVAAGRQLAKRLELPSLNDLGFSKTYVRCLQVSEIVNSMKGFMDFCRDQKLGPIEGMKIISGSANPAKLQLQKVQEFEQLAGIQGLSSNWNTLNKPVAQQQGLGNQQINNHEMVSRGALSNNQNQLTRQNSMNSNSSSQQEAISSSSNLNQIPSSSVLGSSVQNLPVSGFSKPHLLQPQHCSSGKSSLQQNHFQTSHRNQAMQQQMIQQLLQNINKGNTGSLPQQQCRSGQSASGSGGEDRPGFGVSSLAVGTVDVHGSEGANGSVTTTSDSHRGTPNSESSAAGNCQKTPDVAQNVQLSEEFVQEMVNEFAESGYFSSDLEDAMPFNCREE